MQTRSQTRILSTNASMATSSTPKKETRCHKNISTATVTFACKTPVFTITQLTAPDAPVQTRYRTRSSTTSNHQSIATIDNEPNEAVFQKNLAQEFDAAFFDESSAAWNANKKKTGNGMYSYRTRSRK
jgi:hypothetical protein